MYIVILDIIDLFWYALQLTQQPFSHDSADVDRYTHPTFPFMLCTAPVGSGLV